MLNEYLEKSKYVNYDDSNVRNMADRLRAESVDELSLVKNTYLFVRDEISHSWDVQDKRVTVSASDVLREGVGICWAKANLLAALLRANGIPAGFSYQRLTLGDTPDTGYCIHALNTVYIKSLNKWIRLDARGNKKNVYAQFALGQERLAFPVREELGEADYGNNDPDLDERLVKILNNTDNILTVTTDFTMEKST